ncbi:hypothetical protein AC578_5333 [Pseudocercospora eumusae]|uniref:Myb-like domain-containing protein n=1 Tax=Pseudocercospora eumusae TaxID=321146 RepID=A0A139H2S0_9PEZI|nr:hypothetical protein AC578_5333 [Pseudocercospora eumusae]
MFRLLGTRGWHVRTNAVTRCANFHVNAVAKAEKVIHRPESSQPKRKPGGAERGPRRLWSAEELQNLKQMYEKGIPKWEIALHLGRSRCSVAGKITYSRDSQRWTHVKQTWDESEEEKLLVLHEQGKTWAEIGRILGRSLGSVRNKFSKIRPSLSLHKWTDEDHEIASKLHSQGYSASRIGRELKRPASSVAYYIVGGQYQRQHAAKPWTPEEESEMFAMHNAGFSAYEIAEKLGRKRQIIASRLRPRSKVMPCFSRSEDADLKKLRGSGKSWKEVRDAMASNRTVRQLRDRWSNLTSSGK